MSKPFLDKFTTIIMASQELSDKSKQTYAVRLRRLTDITGHDVDWIIDHCSATLGMLKDKAAETKKGFINSILAVFKYTDKLKAKKPKTYKCWFDNFNKVKAITQAKYDNIQPSERQIKAYVPWADVIQARDKLHKDSDTYLWPSPKTRSSL